jgi:vacuolar-type H+-ATPase subunit E/Vma4
MEMKNIREILVAKFKASLILGKIPVNLIETMINEAEKEINSIVSEAEQRVLGRVEIDPEAAKDVFEEIESSMRSATCDDGYTQTWMGLSLKEWSNLPENKKRILKLKEQNSREGKE